jgi:hypothetical protein
MISYYALHEFLKYWETCVGVHTCECVRVVFKLTCTYVCICVYMCMHVCMFVCNSLAMKFLLGKLSAME